MTERCGNPGDYDRWFIAKVQASINDQRPGILHEEVMAEMEALIRRAGEK